MLTQQHNNPPVASHHAPLPTLASADEAVNTRQSALVLQVGSDLDPGLERKQRPNEDTLFVIHGVMPSASPKPFALLVVADGMGGQAHGQEASQLAVGSLVEYVCGSLYSKQMTPEAFLPLLIEGVKSANRAVYQRNQEQRTVMGTTMTATLVVDTTAYVAHVGDSRLYLYREAEGLSQITQDHSLVAALVAAGVIQPEDIYTHPMRNLIYRFLGEKSTVEVDGCTVPLAAGDILLLCSDGLWEMVRDRQIAAILTTLLPDPSRKAHALIQAALAGGGVDNVSVIVVQVSKQEHLSNRPSSLIPRPSSWGLLFLAGPRFPNSRSPSG
ncbi:MAG TPA: protein phosphatase 2C domain-containing protein [Ktedonobacteraceae bacterium]